MEDYVNVKKIGNDPVHHPSHYETGKYECIDVMEEALGRDAVEGFCLCNAFKYIYRSGRKNGTEDLEKAVWYLNRILNKHEDPQMTYDNYNELLREYEYLRKDNKSLIAEYKELEHKYNELVATEDHK